MLGVSLQVEVGQLALVVGSSGCGKSTLLRCLNGLVPHFSGGTLEGRIRVNGRDPVRLGPAEMCKHVGFVFQDPEAQFVVDQVEDEIAFALENSGISRAEMHARVQFVLETLDLVRLRDRKLDTLSGGERQRVAIASALSLQPAILALDEPTSQLDPQAAEGLLETLVALKDRLQLTILLVEHRLERVLPFADQVIYLETGRHGVISGSPRAVLSQIPVRPPVTKLAQAFGWEPLPLTVEEAQEMHEDKLESTSWQPASQDRAVQPAFPTVSGPVPPILKAGEIVAGYGNEQVLHGLNLELYPGEVLVLMGANGAGKSTLLRCLAGLNRPRQGSIKLAGKNTAGLEVADICLQVGYLPQDPNALLFADTVQDELLITLRNHQLSSQDYPPKPLLERLGLASLAQAYPRDLSSGERQRVALGAVMIPRPPVLLLDEPTRGLDYSAKESLVDLLNRWKSEGTAIILVTHDVELAASVATRVAWMENGEIKQIGLPAEIFGMSSAFTPQIARLFPGSGWLTVQDVLSAKLQ